jgi:hypothetical protein
MSEVEGDYRPLFLPRFLPQSQHIFLSVNLSFCLILNTSPFILSNYHIFEILSIPRSYAPQPFVIHNITELAYPAYHKMTKALQPHSMKLVIDWFELDDDAYPDVGLPLGISVFVELQVEPDSVFTVMKGVDGVINLESTWYKGVTKIADKAPRTSVEDVEYRSSHIETEEGDYLDTQEDLYSADDLDENDTKSEDESGASSSRTITQQRFTTRPRPKPSKIPVRKSGTDGAFDDLDFDLDIPPSPTLSSQDSLPWHSTKDTDDYMDDENGQTGMDIDDLFTDLDDIYQPIIRYENGNITLHAAREVEPGFYRVEIAFYHHFTRDTQGWYGVDLCNVVKTCPPIPGKLIFNLQTHPSLVTDIVGPDDLHDMDDGSRAAPFDPREEPYLAFWAWTRATYLEFWGEEEVDKTYYDDLIAPNAYLESDELVDYVEFMYKTRDDEKEEEEDDDDVATETVEAPEKVSQSNHYMSPIAEEEEEKEGDQVDDMMPGNITLWNVDNTVSGPEECSMTPISEEEECGSEEAEDVVWEGVLIPDVENVGCDPEEGPVSSSDEEEVENMVPEDVTTLNVENVVSESEEASVTPIIEEELPDMVLEDATEPNIESVTSESEAPSMIPFTEKEVDNMILEHVRVPNVESVVSVSEERSKTPSIEEKIKDSKPEDITAPNVDKPKPPAEDEEDDLRFGGPYHPPPSPTFPTYAEPLECYEIYQAMMAAHATFRRRALFFLHRVLPALFVLILTICACMNGPPVTASTPTSTLHTVKYYANHLGGLSYNALMNVNVPFPDFGAYQREWFEAAATSFDGGKEDEDSFLWKLVDETLERAGFTDCPAVFESAELTAESVVSPIPSQLDGESSANPEMATEARTPALTSTPDPASDVTLPLNPEITSTLDLPTTTTTTTTTTTPPPSGTDTAVLSLAINEPALPRLCPRRHADLNAPYPADCPPPPAHTPAPTILTGLAKDIFRHIACSTSPICTISRISDKYEPSWDIFARFRCDGKGGWEPDTRRDGFDRFLGWAPDECRVET